MANSSNGPGNCGTGFVGVDQSGFSKRTGGWNCRGAARPRDARGVIALDKLPRLDLSGRKVGCLKIDMPHVIDAESDSIKGCAMRMS